MSPSFPPALFLVTPPAAQRVGGESCGRPHCTLEDVTGDPHPFKLQMEAGNFDREKKSHFEEWGEGKMQPVL